MRYCVPVDNNQNKNTMKQTVEQERQQQVEQTVGAVDKFFNENKKTIWGVLGAIVVVGLVVLGYQKLILQPQIQEAQAQLFAAEDAYAAGQFELALKGDGNVLGFEEIAAEYGSKAGKAIWLYAGSCELQLGNYEQALTYLKKYNGKDEILAARALACQGDCYASLEDYKAALDCYTKAAAKADNMFAATYMLKAAVVCEELGQNDKALALYKEIKDKYPQSMEGYDIDKYITRIQNAE